MNNHTSFSFENFVNIANEFSSCMNDYLYVFDIKNDIYHITSNALSRFTLPSDTFNNVLENHKLFVHEDDLEMLKDDLRKMTSGEKDTHDLTYRWIGKTEKIIWINCKGKILRNEQNEAVLMIGCVNEVGKAQLADNLSGLFSIDTFKLHLEQNKSRMDNAFTMRIGIDDLRPINERLGLEYGDQVLSEVARCIHANLLPDQYVYRIISDEFMVLDLSGKSSDDMITLYHAIRSSIDTIIEQHHYEALYTVSAGLVSFSQLNSYEYDEILKISEFALSEAKANGKNQLYSFNPDDYTTFLRRKYIHHLLYQAINDNFKGFSLAYQPIVDLGTHTLFAAESLLRFQSSEGEVLLPYEFIPILEESGLIIPVGKWIIKTALNMCITCQKKYPDFKISINLSYIQLLKSPIFDDIKDSLKDANLSPGSLITELTESGYLDNTPPILSIWRNLKSIGVNIAVDDFGTGYSNLHSIGNLKPDIVKIDRSFTLKALQNEYESQLMAHIIQMVHSINLKLVVEGIETKQELDKISVLHPDYIQGYYFGKPCTQEQFLEDFIYTE